jgi:hypothetical protein
MALFLLVLDPRSTAPYDPLKDAIERRLQGKRILKTSWVIEEQNPDAILSAIRMHLPVKDGLVIVPWGEPKVTKNLRPTT